MSGLTTSQTADLARLSRDIHAHPELAYHERHAVAADVEGHLWTFAQARPTMK